MLTCLINGKPNNLIDAKYTKDDWKKWTAKGIVTCPVCNKPYEYCHGRVRIPYFRHKDKAECQDRYSEPETQEHLQGKIDLYDWLKTVDEVTELTLEGWLACTKQRPDLYFRYKGEEYVIEYQCSPISSEYIERHSLYEAAGIHDIWICGTLNYFQEYHNGNGRKRVNIIEKENKIYYDIKEKKLFLVDEMSRKVFEKSNYKVIKLGQCNPFGYHYHISDEDYKGNYSRARASLLNMNELLTKLHLREVRNGRDQSTSV